MLLGMAICERTSKFCVRLRQVRPSAAHSPWAHTTTQCALCGREVKPAGHGRQRPRVLALEYSPARHALQLAATVSPRGDVKPTPHDTHCRARPR